MALIECPNCSKKVSDRAAACPHCGYQLKQHKSAIPARAKEEMNKHRENAKTIVAIVLFILGLLVLFLITTDVPMVIVP